MEISENLYLEIIILVPSASISDYYPGPTEDLQGTLRGLILSLWLAFVLHIYSFLLQEKQIFRCFK